MNQFSRDEFCGWTMHDTKPNVCHSVCRLLLLRRQTRTDTSARHTLFVFTWVWLFTSGDVRIDGIRLRSFTHTYIYHAIQLIDAIGSDNTDGERWNDTTLITFSPTRIEIKKSINSTNHTHCVIWKTSCSVLTFLFASLYLARTSRERERGGTGTDGKRKWEKGREIGDIGKVRGISTW